MRGALAKLVQVEHARALLGGGDPFDVTIGEVGRCSMKRRGELLQLSRRCYVRGVGHVRVDVVSPTEAQAVIGHMIVARSAEPNTGAAWVLDDGLGGEESRRMQIVLCAWAELSTLPGIEVEP